MKDVTKLINIFVRDVGLKIIFDFLQSRVLKNILSKSLKSILFRNDLQDTSSLKRKTDITANNNVYTKKRVHFETCEMNIFVS